MDGHGGTAASKKVSVELPLELTTQLVVNRRLLESSLTEAWSTDCRSYQVACQEEEGECIADYDIREGTLSANTGSKDLIAGTTASIMALDETNGELVALNCGDSRSMVVTSEGKIQLVTRDHTPETEEERLQQGVAMGLDYSLPTCKISKWTISAGKYEYSVGRSLEGPFVTSKGIVSEADVTKTYVGVGEILFSATDGLWEVMDSEEVAIDLARMRRQGMNARDVARAVCSMALAKGTADNVSAVVVYL
jgi:serine/threonine protein phosphatase PrpC